MSFGKKASHSAPTVPGTAAPLHTGREALRGVLPTR